MFTTGLDHRLLWDTFNDQNNMLPDTLRLYNNRHTCFDIPDLINGKVLTLKKSRKIHDHLRRAVPQQGR